MDPSRFVPTDAMTDQPQLSALDLAAYLCSKVCHDIISPVGAINNGLEVLEEEEAGDGEMHGFAMELIQKSAQQASAKLQFARLAFGAAGSAGAQIDLADAEKVTRGLLAGSKVELSWTAPSAVLAKDKIKLLLNLVLTAHQAIPRGGTIAVNVGGPPEAPQFTLDCAGTGARLPKEAAAFFTGGEHGEPIDAHSIQPYFAALVAREAGMAVALGHDGDTVVITARTAA